MTKLTETFKGKAAIAGVAVLTTFSCFGVESASATGFRRRRPVGRFYGLPASTNIGPASVTPTMEGDLTIITAETTSDFPGFGFSILNQEDGEPISDNNSSATIGVFPNAIPSFSFILERQTEVNTTIQDSEGNILSEESITDSEIITSTNLSDGDLSVEQGVNNDLSTPENGITYGFDFGENFIDFILPESSFSLVEGLDPFLAVNDISYIVEQNLFGQASFLENLVLANTNFDLDNVITPGSTLFENIGNDIEFGIIEAEAVPESSNVLGLFTLGFLSTGFLVKVKLQRKAKTT